ncbi:MAG: DnaA N-terminal domain-containing protein, partial [Eubacterium sp.]
MDDSIAKIWENTLSIIKEEIPELSYKTWFSHTKPLKFINGTFYIISDNDFERGMLETRYKGLLTNAISQMMDQKCM